MKEKRQLRKSAVKILLINKIDIDIGATQGGGEGRGERRRCRH